MQRSIHILTLLLFSCLFSFSTVVTAQTTNVTGKVIDGESKATMPGSTVMLLYPKDSTFYKFGITNPEGVFSIKAVEVGNYILQVSFIGYDSYKKPISINAANKELMLEDIVLQTKQEILNTVEVVEEMVPVIINGDTVEFNADAFKTQPEDNVKDLLEKLPGVEVDKDGVVKAQGEEVKKVLVDGKDFFGDDTKLATENLPADMVKKVQVYDDQSEMSKLTGVDDGQRTKTINLKIKKDRKKGVFGKITGAGGLTAQDWGNMENERGLFSGKFNINKFKDNEQISTLGLFNNINQQGFSYRDYINFAGGASQAMQNSGGSFRSFGSNAGIPLSSNPDDGFTTTKAGGINWNRDLSKRTMISGSYFYNEVDKHIYSEVDRQYINSDESNFSTSEKTNQFELNKNHRLTLKLEHAIDSTQDLKVSGNVIYAEGNQRSLSSNQTNDASGLQLNSSNSNNQNTGTNFNGSGTVIYGKRFSKKGRSLVANATVDNSSNEKVFVVNTTNNLFDTLTSSLVAANINQVQNETNNYLSYSAKVSFTEPIGKAKYMELSYQRRNNNDDYVKEFYDILGPGNESFNGLLSLDYKNDYTYDNFGSKLKMNTTNSYLTIGAYAQKTVLDGEIVSNDFALTRTQWNILPSLNYKYNFSKSSRINFDYTTNVQEPSLQQLQPTIDNSDPLNIYQGNPNLKTEYRHNGALRFMSFNQFSFTNVFAMLNASYTKNKITNAQSLNRQFIQTTQPVNVDYDMSLSAYGYFGTPIRAIKSKINIRANSTVSQSILFINDVENNVNRYFNSLNFSIENRKKEVIDASVGIEVSQTISSYSISKSLDQTFYTNVYFAEFLVDFKSDWTFETELDYTFYAGDQFDDNPAIPILEASLSKRFLKGKSGMLKLKVYDILNKNVGINRNNNLNFIEDQRVTTLSRYVMLSFSYKIRRFGGKRKRKAATEETENTTK